MKAPGLLQMLTLRGHSFFPVTLGPKATVLDLGAHKGEFSRGLVHRFGCRCIAVEANPRFMAELERVPGIEALNYAVAECGGELELHLSNNLEAASVLGAPRLEPSGETVVVQAKSLSSLIKEYDVDRIDLVKMDIEGAEIGVLLYTPAEVIHRIDQISVEFHDFCGLYSIDDVVAVCDRLDGLGFEGIKFGRTNMNWLFVRRRCAEIGLLRRKYVRHGVCNMRNVLHGVRARIGVQWIGLSDE